MNSFYYEVLNKDPSISREELINGDVVKSYSIGRFGIHEALDEAATLIDLTERFPEKVISYLEQISFVHVLRYAL